MNDTFVRPARRTILDLVRTTHLNGGKIHLFSNNLQVNDETVETDLTESAFTGYAAVTTTTWGAVTTGTDGQAHSASPLAAFASSGPAAPQLAYGWYFDSVAAGTPLFFCGNFDSPVPFNDVGDGITFVLDVDTEDQVRLVVV